MDASAELLKKLKAKPEYHAFNLKSKTLCQQDKLYYSGSSQRHFNYQHLRFPNKLVEFQHLIFNAFV